MPAHSTARRCPLDFSNGGASSSHAGLIAGETRARMPLTAGSRYLAKLGLKARPRRLPRVGAPLVALEP